MKAIIIFIIPPILFFLILLVANFNNLINPVVFNSILYGFIISTINILLGILALNYGLEKNDKIFLITVFGGLLLRLFIILLLILLTLKFLFVSLNSFIFTTFIFYFYYLIVEVYILTRKKNIKIKSSND